MKSSEDIGLTSNEIEAANRAEAIALLIRAGYRVYRPEADCYVHLYEWMEGRHGHTPLWNRTWSYPSISEELSCYLDKFVVQHS